MLDNVMNAILIVGFSFSLVSAVIWFFQWMHERQWQFIGDDTRLWCLKRMAINIVATITYAAFWFILN